MTLFAKSIAAARFDFSRSFRPSRLAIAGVLACFPPLMMIVTSPGNGIELAPAIIGITVMMVGLLALLLWATPIVHQELEGKTWTYIAIRPHGRVSLLLGKYLMSVVWTIFVCELAMMLSVLVVAILKPSEMVWKMFLVYSFLIVLAAFAYAAFFLLFGIIFHRRSMVLVVSYMILMEGAVARIPALINQVTMSHHLMLLAFRWLEFSTGDQEADNSLNRLLGNNETSAQNIGLLIITPIILMAVSIYLIRNKEYITADES